MEKGNCGVREGEEWGEGTGEIGGRKRRGDIWKKEQEG